jgi:hypothetical protein
MRDFAAMAMYKLAAHHTEGATAMYGSHFIARAETYTDHDRCTASMSVLLAVFRTCPVRSATQQCHSAGRQSPSPVRPP